MTLYELHNQPKYVRVLASTYLPANDTKAMIGGEYEVRREYYDDNTVDLWNKDKSNYSVFNRSDFVFNRSDIQFLTPVEFKGKKIGIGDRIRDNMFGTCIVYDYYWLDGAWNLLVVEVDGDMDSDCHEVEAEHITDHRPLTAPDPAKAKWEEEGRKNGWIT